MYTMLFWLDETLVNQFGRTKQPPGTNMLKGGFARGACNLCNSFGLGFSRKTVDIDSTMDIILITSNLFTVAFDERKFACKFLQRRMCQIASIAILSNQLQCYLFALPPNQKRNVRLLHTFRLIDRATNLDIFSLNICLFF